MLNKTGTDGMVLEFSILEISPFVKLVRSLSVCNVRLFSMRNVLILLAIRGISSSCTIIVCFLFVNFLLTMQAIAQV